MFFGLERYGEAAQECQGAVKVNKNSKNLTQNSTADGIIDPSHIIFKFSGEDIFGNKYG